LYKEVTSRGGFETVIMNKMWRSVTNELSVDPDRTDAGFRLRAHYLKYLYPFERRFFLGLNDDDNDFDFAAFERMLTKNNRERDVQPVDEMNSEMYDNNQQDQMAHYPFPPAEELINNTNHNGNNSMHNKNGNGRLSTRIGTRSRTGVRIGGSTLSSPEGKETNNNNNYNERERPERMEKERVIKIEREPIKKGRGKRSRADKEREAAAAAAAAYEESHVPLTSNFSKLDVVALKKYKQYHQMRVDTTANKNEMIEAVSVHFSQQQVDEYATIRKFVAHVKNETDNKKEKEARRRNSKIVRA